MLARQNSNRSDLPLQMWHDVAENHENQVQQFLLSSTSLPWVSPDVGEMQAELHCRHYGRLRQSLAAQLWVAAAEAPGEGPKALPRCLAIGAVG